MGSLKKILKEYNMSEDAVAELLRQILSKKEEAQNTNSDEVIEAAPESAPTAPKIEEEGIQSEEKVSENNPNLELEELRRKYEQMKKDYESAIQRLAQKNTPIQKSSQSELKLPRAPEKSALSFTEKIGDTLYDINTMRYGKSFYN